MKIDGRDVNQVSGGQKVGRVAPAFRGRRPTPIDPLPFEVVMVGTVLSMESQALANNYVVDDGTGRIDVRWWTEENNGDAMADKRSQIR